MARLAELVRHTSAPPHPSAPAVGRNAFTRAVDRLILWIRSYLPPLHWAGAALFGLTMYLYAWMAGRSSRLVAVGSKNWPDFPEHCVLAIWHGSAPTLLAAIAKSRPQSPLAILVATEPRGDALMILCRLLGLRVIRGDWEHHGWPALAQLSDAVAAGASAVITPDGGGPRHMARAGALVLAATARAPLVPIGAECRPAISEPHKWDKQRSPLPFGRIAIAIEPSLEFDDFPDAAALESGRRLLQERLRHAWLNARQTLQLPAAK